MSVLQCQQLHFPPVNPLTPRPMILLVQCPAPLPLSCSTFMTSLLIFTLALVALPLSLNQTERTIRVTPINPKSL